MQSLKIKITLILSLLFLFVFGQNNVLLVGYVYAENNRGLVGNVEVKILDYMTNVHPLDKKSLKELIETDQMGELMSKKD